MVRRIAEALGLPLTDSSTKFKKATDFPHVKVNRAQLADGIDGYIRTRLFAAEFDPFADENWRVLLVDPVTEHIIRVWARKILEAESMETIVEAEITHRLLSEVPKLTMRESSSLAVDKSIYLRLRYIKEDGLPAFYHPDFLVRCGENIYLVETKGQGMVNAPNVKRKKRAAVAWCDRINALSAEQ